MSGERETPRVLPPRQVPTLTEVVDEDLVDEQARVMSNDVEDDAGVAPEVQDAQRDEPVDVAADELSLDRSAEHQLVERVLADVQRQIDPLLEQRLREMLAPVLARWSEALVEDSRERLASVLHDVVAQAVARELERQRRR
ncbi:MAG: hypothetical protein H0W40_09605 [Methylibium sp.]|uniref:hypothetical protein n=1 Tax=Methylibium sp. TaxID=2067992 RepID=UPI0017E25B20|nr:hypothetical protein [Methylibium sp.]MBA3597622.1 hypothetical protein [Methylibium sp.]